MTGKRASSPPRMKASNVSHERLAYSAAEKALALAGAYEKKTRAPLSSMRP